VSAEIGKAVRQATWQEVLADLPPHKVCRVEVQQDNSNRFVMPEIRMHCPVCDAVMLFECTGRPSSYWEKGAWRQLWATYTCKHCENFNTAFALLMRAESPIVPDWLVQKVGQHPPHGPRVPARVIKLIEPEREQFLKGRRAESQGFGIGAFGYYRRVVESQRDRLLDAIITAAERTNVPADKVEGLRKARAETRFKESMKLAEEALPDSLFINGHNPLKILHGALSEGLHELSDEDCLNRAEAVREVLTALAERLSEVTKEQASLTAALEKLRAPRTHQL
jgi:hypothetical protein